VTDSLIAALTLVPFYLATLATDQVPRRIRWLPLGSLCVLSFLLAWELTRYDQGHGQALFLVGTVGAPLGAIFGGASWGTRRFYGWPDLGPHPSRLGLWCLAILLGVLVGSKHREQDVRVSQERGDALIARVEAWRQAHGGATPASLAAAAPDAPTTRMGSLAPPPFELRTLEGGALALVFPLSTHVEMRRTLGAGGWEASRVRGQRAP
jgi:hypothetical protein